MSRYTMCPVCGHRMRKDLDACGNWDGETYICDRCSEEVESGEALIISDAAALWAANGKDENYTFGYAEDELKAAL